MIALKDARTLSCWDAHFSYVLKIALCFQIIHIAHIAPVGLPSYPPRDLLNPLTVAITSLFPADVPHLPPFPTLLMSSHTATGWRLLKLCTHCDLTHWDGKKPIFCSAGALLSSHSFPNYQLRLSSSHLHSAAAALLPFSSQTNFERLTSTVDAKCHRVGGGSTRIDHSWFDFPLIQLTGTAMFCQWRGVPSIDSIVRVSVMPFFCFVSDKINRFD